MPRIASLSSFALLLAVPLLAGGCVQQDKYDQLLQAHRSLQEQNVALEDERDTAKANLDTLRDQLHVASNELGALRSKYNLTEEELKRMGLDYDELTKRVAGLDFGPLPEGLSHDLEQLAAAHPDMLTFDAKRGMLRFSSDFTFGSGSADLTSSAASSLTKLASILNSSSANRFETRIIGHTDNVPVSKPDTKRNHPTNWHLSAHRAISVGNALISSGVGPQRVQVAGYGEYRPVVTNPAKGGAAENRRVEIFLVPMPDDFAATGSATVAAPTGKTMDEPMK